MAGTFGNQGMPLTSYGVLAPTYCATPTSGVTHFISTTNIRGFARGMSAQANSESDSDAGDLNLVANYSVIGPDAWVGSLVSGHFLTPVGQSSISYATVADQSNDTSDSADKRRCRCTPIRAQLWASPANRSPTPSPLPPCPSRQVRWCLLALVQRWLSAGGGQAAALALDSVVKRFLRRSGPDIVHRFSPPQAAA